MTDDCGARNGIPATLHADLRRRHDFPTVRYGEYIVVWAARQRRQSLRQRRAHGNDPLFAALAVAYEEVVPRRLHVGSAQVGALLRPQTRVRPKQ